MLLMTDLHIMQLTATTSKDIGERHGYLNRANCTWFFPTLVNTMVTKAGGQIDLTQH